MTVLYISACFIHSCPRDSRGRLLALHSKPELYA